MSRCIGATSTGALSPCTNGGATWTSKSGAWTGDQQSFILPYEIFHGDPGNPSNDCGAAASGTGCGHLIAGTVRVWETITGAAAGTGGTVTWYVNSPANLTKGTLGNRSFINQLAFEPKMQSVVAVGTNDANVQIGRGIGCGSGPTRASGTITAPQAAVAGETFTSSVTQTFTWRAARPTPEVTDDRLDHDDAPQHCHRDHYHLVGVVTAARAGAIVIVTRLNRSGR